MEFDFEWRGKQNIALNLNPAPKVLQSIPLVKQIVDYTMSWSVSALCWHWRNFAIYSVEDDAWSLLCARC